MTDLEALSETLSPEFIQAAEALRFIPEREAEYWYYQARLDFLRVQATLEREARETRVKLEAAQKTLAAIAEKEKAIAEKEKAIAEKKQAQTEIDQALDAERRESTLQDQALEAERRKSERLEALLRKAGILLEE